MDYEKAERIGDRRARLAAAAIERWTGLKASPLIRYTSDGNDCAPVGKRSWKEILPDGREGKRNRYGLLLFDAAGAGKAFSLEKLTLDRALKLAEKLPFPVFPCGEGELWKTMRKRRLSRNAPENGRSVGGRA